MYLMTYARVRMAVNGTIRRTKTARNLQNPLTVETILFGALFLYSGVV